MATGQAERSEELARRQRLSLALTEAVLWSVENSNRQNPFNQFIAALFGAVSGGNPSVEALRQLREQQPDDVMTLLTLGLPTYG